MKLNRPIKLIGKRVNLCPVDEKDLDIFHRWITDLEVTKTTVSSSKIFTVADELRWIKEIQAKVKDGTGFTLAILTKQGKPIGVTTLLNVEDVHRKADFGIAIGEKAYWGRSYGREVTFLMLDFGFNVLNLHSISLEAYSYNKRAISAYKVVGFKNVGRLREAHFWGGKYYDIIKMDILAQEFKNSQIKDMILESQKT